MVDMTPAYNAMLNIRSKVHAEIEWIDTMVEASKHLPAHAGTDFVTHHLVVIKTLLEAQDSVITMQQRSLDIELDFHDQLIKKLRPE